MVDPNPDPQPQSGLRDWINKAWVELLLGLALLVVILGVVWHSWDYPRHQVHALLDLDVPAVVRGLYFFGFLLITFAIIAMIAVAIGVVLKALTAAKPPDIRTEELPLSGLAELIKALTAAPKWIALIVIGLVFIVLGALFDGYRWSDGGFTSQPTVEESGGEVVEASPTSE